MILNANWYDLSKEWCEFDCCDEAKHSKITQKCDKNNKQ